MSDIPMQIDPKMIPAEVVEAAAKAANKDRLGWPEWDQVAEHWKPLERGRARAAIAAGLAAWPVQFSDVDAKGRNVLMLVFPLAQEGGND